jgi:hypothetical protein
MEPITEALDLLQRQARIQESLRQRRGNPVLEERELYVIRQQLTRYPAAVQAIALTAAELHRPIESVRVADVEATSRRSRQLQA